MIKIFSMGIKCAILIMFIFICSSNTYIFEANVVNNNLNKTVDLATMAKKVNEYENAALYSAKNSYIGDLTGYVYNCPACTGRLACLANYDLSGGVTTYLDRSYGEVNIVASSSNLECGTIVRINSANPITAIVLDRGVLGNDLDLLSPNVEYALRNVGRSTTSYDVLRVGWGNQTYAG